jgi:hypothetical protein
MDRKANAAKMHRFQPLLASSSISAELTRAAMLEGSHQIQHRWLEQWIAIAV